MEKTFVTKMDSKGRVLIPDHISKILKVDSGMEIVLAPDENGMGVKLLPLLREKTAKLRFLIRDSPGSLAEVAEFLSANRFSIIMSESRMIQKNKLAEWDVIVDTSQSGGVEKLRDRISGISAVKNLVVVK